MLQSCSCPLCISDRRRPIYNIDGHTLVRCSDCSLVYVDARIDSDKIYRIYADRYFRSGSSGYGDYESESHLRIRTFKRWYDQIAPRLSLRRGSALDIGCAAGYFLELLKDKGWQAEGIELNSDMLALVRKKGYPVAGCPLELFESGKRYALITLFDVIEHLPFPKAHMRRLADLLLPEGTIAIVTPDFGSPHRMLFGKRWFQFKPIEHLIYFDRQTMGKLAEESGLRLVYSAPCGQYADLPFLTNRLRRYGFPLLAGAFDVMTRAFGMNRHMWYAGTGSILVLLQKSKADQ